MCVPTWLCLGIQVVVTNTLPGVNGTVWGDVYVIPDGALISTFVILWQRHFISLSAALTWYQYSNFLIVCLFFNVHYPLANILLIWRYNLAGKKRQNLSIRSAYTAKGYLILKKGACLAHDTDCQSCWMTLRTSQSNSSCNFMWALLHGIFRAIKAQSQPMSI